MTTSPSSAQTGLTTLLTLEQAAELLHRTPAGLRATMSGHTEFSEILRAARCRLGRRVYLRADRLQAAIEAATGL